ncbi:hypothetical protein D5086_001040 [Populus alba]|uniref:Uncharacterized protein n=1 Tax=Populus alba TaxID=43335 RepID=A0ACC4CZ50_POPAL
MEFNFIWASEIWGLTALLYLYECGSVEKAYELFHGLNKKVAVAYSAMISGFGMNGKPYSRAWRTLLLACSVHNNVEFGEIAAQRCFDLEPNATAYYSLLANIHSSAGRWDDVRRLRKLWKDKKLSKLSGCS